MPEAENQSPRPSECRLEGIFIVPIWTEPGSRRAICDQYTHAKYCCRSAFPGRKDQIVQRHMLHSSGRCLASINDLALENGDPPRSPRGFAAIQSSWLSASVQWHCKPPCRTWSAVKRPAGVLGSYSPGADATRCQWRQYWTSVAELARAIHSRPCSCAAD